MNNYETHGKQSSIVIAENNTNSELIHAICDLKNKIDSIGNGYDDLRVLLEELEAGSLEDRTSIKKRIGDWMSQSANIITIGSAVYNNKQLILDGVQHILNLL